MGREPVQDLPHRDPHGIKDERIREFIQRARTSRGPSQAGHPVTPGGAVFQHRHLVKAMQKLVPYVRQPTLIVHPIEDDYAAMNNATYLRDHLQGPVELTVLDDCYHIVTVDRQRHLVVEGIVKCASSKISSEISPATLPQIAFQSAIQQRDRPANMLINIMKIKRR